MFYFGYHKSQELSLFRYFLSEVLSGNNDTFKKDLNTIITETSALAKGEKNNFQINNDYYSLIVFLSKYDASFFKAFSGEPGIEEYQKLHSILNRSDALTAFQ